MKHVAIAALFFAMVSSGASAQVNAGEQKSDPNLPFTVTQITTLSLPWKIAFLPDGRMLITEKVGGMSLVTQQGEKTPVANIPAVEWKGQGGMLGVYLSPHYAQDHYVYLTYSEPGEPGGSSLALARAELKISNGTASLEGLKVIWRDGARGQGGQFGAEVAFSPDSKYLYLSVGDRQRMTPAQDPEPAARQDSAAHAGWEARTRQSRWRARLGTPTVPVIDPPADTEVAKTAPGGEDVHLSRPKPDAVRDLEQPDIRTPYGLAFAPDGRLWETRAWAKAAAMS